MPKVNQEFLHNNKIHTQVKRMDSSVKNIVFVTMPE